MELNKYDANRCFRFLPRPLVREMEAGTVFVGGGYVTNTVNGDKVNDIDVFVGSADSAVTLVEKLKGEHRVVKTDNAITILSPMPIQVIHRWVFNDIENVAASFDFTICCAAIGFKDGKRVSYCCDSFYQDLAARRLSYRHPVRNEDAGGSMLRLLKYVRRGYHPPLDSVAGVIARLTKGVITSGLEAEVTATITRLLVEVDPSADIVHAHDQAES